MLAAAKTTQSPLSRSIRAFGRISSEGILRHFADRVLNVCFRFFKEKLEEHEGAADVLLERTKEG